MSIKYMGVPDRCPHGVYADPVREGMACDKCEIDRLQLALNKSETECGHLTADLAEAREDSERLQADINAVASTAQSETDQLRQEIERLRARCSPRGTLVSEHRPPPHTRYAVLRGNEIFTATPCYGMHEPWWVVRTMADEHPFEADPVAMEPDDLWWPIVEFAEAARAAGGEHE